MLAIGRALARLARNVSGQSMLELPDDLPPSVVAKLLQGANDEVLASPEFALFAHDQRQDIGSINPRVDFRELAIYRQGSHMAVAFASDNRGMATYASVYPLLLSSGFPTTDTGSGGTGIAGLPEFAGSLASVLEQQVGTHGIKPREFRVVVENILAFLASAYEIAGNGQASIASDWWLHVQDWTDAIAIPVSEGESTGIARLYGCAGLPVPVEGGKLKIDPRAYVAILAARWSNPTAIASELARLQGIEGAQKAATTLSRLDWENSHALTSLRSDSPVARVALALGVDRSSRATGWSALREDHFDSFVEAKGKLGVRRAGVDLPLPWKNASPALVASRGESTDGLALNDIELVVPFKSEADKPRAQSDVARLQAGIRIYGSRGSQATFQATSAALSHDGLHLLGTLHLTPSKKSPNLVWLEADATGDASPFLVDHCSGSFTLIRSTEAGLWIKPQGRAPKSALRGPVIWSATDTEPASLDLPGAGPYEFAIAWGDESGLGSQSILIDRSPPNHPWPGMDARGAMASRDVIGSLGITSAEQSIFRVELTADVERPLSPILAAAQGTLPNTSRPPTNGALGYLEEILGDILASLQQGSALGCILVSDTRRREGLIALGEGTLCTPDLKNHHAELSPGAPSDDLLNLPAYSALREAYRALGIPDTIASIEAEEGTAGLTVSRIPLAGISRESIEALLEAYRGLLAATPGLSSSTDRFWARNPFSVAVFREGIGLRSAQAALLSPLHPIRLAWAWALQVGLREAFDDGENPAASLALLDGTNFPSSCVVDDAFGTPSALMPVPIDAHPESVYLGWHVSVAIAQNNAVIPEWAAGFRFPIDGLSALSASAVKSAIDEFLRVSPHVQSMRLELAAANRARRSSAIDDGVLGKLRDLAIASPSLDGVAGVRVLDSTNRLGEAPRFSSIDDSIALSRPGFNLEWTSVAPDGAKGSHITFLEGSAAQLSMARIPTSGTGWLPTLPLRRTPQRLRQQNYAILDYSLRDQGPSGNPLARTLVAYERDNDGHSYALRIIPNLSGITGKPNWLVAGDFGIDPQALSHATKTQADGDYILWDWRPVTTVKANGDAGGRAQPYFVLASVPAALNRAIRDRLQLLNGTLDPAGIQERTKTLMRTLAERAVGLNTLLAVGHHQATGALGFFFALRSLESWMAEAPEHEARLVIPVDAVDPFLRASSSSAGDGSRRRADLLAARAWIDESGNVRVTLAPIEIKHYGLTQQESEPSFPLAGEARLNEHLEQLANYQSQLERVCEAYRKTAGSRSSILGQRIAAILDAAIQLSNTTVRDASNLLSAIATGQATVEIGKGVLLWYQAGATGIDGAKASWNEAFGPHEFQRVDVRVDPVAFDASFWDGKDDEAHVVVRDALDNATEVNVRIADVPTPALASSAASPAAPPIVAAGGGVPSITTAPKASPAHPTAPSINKADYPSMVPAATSSVGPSPEPSEPAQAASRKKLPPAELEKRYGAVLAALGEFNVKVERPRGLVPYQEGPGFVEYSVYPAYGVSVNRIESQLDNLKLRLKLPANALIGCSTHLGNVVLTVPKLDDERYFVDAEDLWSRWKRPEAGFAIPIGENITGEIVTINLASSNSPHLLIAGVTGSGKSEALLTMLHGAARFYDPTELRLRLIDPKQTELNTLSDLPHTDGPIGFTAEEAVVLLEKSAEEMDSRYEIFRKAGQGIRSIDEYRSAIGPMPRWIVVLDEYADLISDDSQKKQIEKLLQRLSQKARASGIHVIVSTQKPVVQVVNTVVRGNLPGKIALRVNTQAESRVILDDGGAEQLLGKGDAIVKAGSGMTRIQFARYEI